MKTRVIIITLTVFACGILQAMSNEGLVDPQYNVLDYTSGVVLGSAIMLTPDLYNWLNKYLVLD